MSVVVDWHLNSVGIGVYCYKQDVSYENKVLGVHLDTLYSKPVDFSMIGVI
jgi:hypothetical protein